MRTGGAERFTWYPPQENTRQPSAAPHYDQWRVEETTTTKRTHHQRRRRACCAKMIDREKCARYQQRRCPPFHRTKRKRRTTRRISAREMSAVRRVRFNSHLKDLLHPFKTPGITKGKKKKRQKQLAVRQPTPRPPKRGVIHRAEHGRLVIRRSPTGGGGEGKKKKAMMNRPAKQGWAFPATQFVHYAPMKSTYVESLWPKGKRNKRGEKDA